MSGRASVFDGEAQPRIRLQPRDQRIAHRRRGGPDAARQRIRIDYYDAGHMMYLHEPSMRKFRDDLVGFIQATDRL